MAVQVWNENELTGVVGAFHIQGSHWDRNKRRFTTSTSSPSSVWAAVAPADVDSMPYVLGRLEEAGCDAASGRYAVLRNADRSVDILDSAQVRNLWVAGYGVAVGDRLQTCEVSLSCCTFMIRFPGYWRVNAV